MSVLQRVVSLILFAVGGLLALLGAFGLAFDSAPPDVSEGTRRTFTLVSAAHGVVGGGLIALGVFLRSRRRMGGVLVAASWVIYGLFWLLLVPLAVFVWEDVSRAVIRMVMEAPHPVREALSGASRQEG